MEDMSKTMSKNEYLKIGKLEIKQSLINDDEFRCVTIYNSSGKVRQIKNYKNNKLSGKIKSYWPNGKVHIEGQYIKGVRSGTFKTYNDKGKVLLKENYSTS